MNARRQRQAEAEQRRKELVEQLEFQERMTKMRAEAAEALPKRTEEDIKRSEFVSSMTDEQLEFVIKLGEEATEILNEAAEDEMVEQIVDEIAEETERAGLLDQVPRSSEVLKDVPWNELDRVTKNAPSTPEDYPVLGCFPDGDDLDADRLSSQGTDGGSESHREEQTDSQVPAIQQTEPDITDSPPTSERQDDLSDEQRPDAEVSGDADKATPSGDGWE